MIQSYRDFIYVVIPFAALYNGPIILQLERNREDKECQKRSLFL
jgi:hypothetical protein